MNRTIRLACCFLIVAPVILSIQQLIADYKLGLSKVSREKGIAAQKIISEYPHDPDHPGNACLIWPDWNNHSTIFTQGD